MYKLLENKLWRKSSVSRFRQRILRLNMKKQDLYNEKKCDIKLYQKQKPFSCERLLKR